MELGLKDKLIVVGGGAGGIGSAVCEILRKEEAQVVIADLKNGVDLGDPHKVKDFFTDLREHYKNLYGYCSLVYGGGGENGVIDADSTEIEKELRDTLLAGVYPIQEAVRWMKEIGEGHIVVVSSINSVLGLNEFAYDLAKGAINRVAPDIATGCGKYGIYAVTLCLGTIGGTPSWIGKEDQLRKIADAIPDKKVTDVNEAARVIAFLLSKHSEVFNGCTLLADRGWHLKPVFK
ncbi:MAG: SDR family oxidoreductase [Patescibacteria group bacterium]|nr:SDR family oxidoreductase [Patescibacteria group bacterium]